MKKQSVFLFVILSILIIAFSSCNKETQNNRPSNMPYVPTTMMVVTPYGVEDCLGQSYLTIQGDFASAGFYNIKMEIIEDLTLADAEKVNTIESISVNGYTDFAGNQEFDSNVEVRIRYHAYRKCNVRISVDFVPNILFSRYDVDVLIDDLFEGTMVHGEDETFTITVDPGEHSVRFENEESSSVKGEMVLHVDCDMEVGYKISCYGDRIDVEGLYVDRLSELPDNKVKIDADASVYKYKNYLDVESTLRNLGFTNIKYNILYDIVFGWTENGEVDNVSIAGKKDFKRGEIFNVNDEVVITYHMPINDSTSNATDIKMAKGSSYYKGMDYQEVKKQFESMGFTNVVLEKVTTEDTAYNDGSVFSVQIGGKSFEAADIVKSNDKVSIKYYVITLVTSGSPVFYSTNDYKTATKGNTGVFAYKKDGPLYDLYWIIDFDEGYVYYFADGDGDSGCDRIKIDSGTLNDRVTITYHDGTDVWSYRLHFKYTNSPVTLIMVDQNGFDYVYSATDLYKALAIRATKKISNY